MLSDGGRDGVGGGRGHYCLDLNALTTALCDWEGRGSSY